MPRQLANAQRRRRPRRSQPRQVLEELPSIDCRWLARKKLFPKDYSTRRYSFDFINPAIHTLTLGPRSAELLLTTGETQLIAIKWLRINGMCQSARPAFQCPGCGHNRFKLFYRHGRFSGCYRCIGVPYASQQLGYKPPAYAFSSVAYRATPKTPPGQNSWANAHTPASSLACASTSPRPPASKSPSPGSSATASYVRSPPIAHNVMPSSDIAIGSNSSRSA
jgi:hypothetical protein